MTLFLSLCVVYVVGLSWLHAGGMPDATHESLQSMIYVSWLLGHTYLAFSMRTLSFSSFAPVRLCSNGLMYAWMSAALIFMLLSLFVSPLRQLLQLTPLSGRQWAVSVSVPLALISLHELIKTVLSYRASR
eukprot:TRINITY_DN5257_c0_g1_i3.p1 TRINITY_DN5257_c0_g1~~TRINITY_DN5257_c0_g1_i3.p1  ORF type:complete len:131 (-),score=16.41 TRINITY_DN5257_c0_g1_i3:98-490(-)